MLIRILAICALSFIVQGAYFKNNEILSLRYLPYCKFDENIINNDELLKIAINKAEVVFSGKVSSEIQTGINNKTIIFRVIVKRFFKGDLQEFGPEVTVSKYLHDGEGSKCRQMIRLRYPAIFLARKAINDTNININLTINPVSITLNNLERINAATTGKLLLLTINSKHKYYCTFVFKQNKIWCFDGSIYSFRLYINLDLHTLCRS